MDTTLVSTTKPMKAYKKKIGDDHYTNLGLLRMRSNEFQHDAVLKPVRGNTFHISVHLSVRHCTLLLLFFWFMQRKT